MKKATHTPGPWRVSLVDDTRVEDATGNCVAEIDGDYNQPETWPAMEANSRLIAAAPDLLEALERMTYLQSGGPVKSSDADKWLKEARAAIAKAKGEA